MKTNRNYSPDMIECIYRLTEVMRRMLLDNLISLSEDDVAIKGDTEMATKINRTFNFNGKKHWIHANSEQEYIEKALKLIGTPASPPAVDKHNFKEYALNWFEVYSKPNIATSTATTYRRQVGRYLLPAFGDKAVEDITTDDVQRLFNSIKGAQSTKAKAKNVLNMILEAAVEDRFIASNPLKSRRLKVKGKASKKTPPYTVPQMQFLVESLDKVQKDEDRMYLALQALHPLRLEEVLGLKWEDVDFDTMTLHIRRAVTHPTRNQPEIKDTKSEASVRDVGLSKIAVLYLRRGKADEFVLGGAQPLSYTKVRKICKRIKEDTEFPENITPRRFRTTVLTDIYEQTHDIKQAQEAAGHTTPTMTLKHYVKGRGDIATAANAIDNIYGGSVG